MIKNAMREPYEFKGEWWIADTPDQKVAGSLIFDGVKTHLVMVGSLLTPATMVAHLLTMNQLTIFGHTISNDFVRLDKCFVTDRSASGASKIKEERWFVHLAFVSKEDYPQDTVFETAEMEFVDLEEWLGVNPFDVEKPDSFSCNVKDPEAITIGVALLDTDIDFGNSIESFGPSVTEYRMTSTGMVRIHPNEAQSFDWFVERLNEMDRFFTLMYGQASDIRAFRLTQGKVRIRVVFGSPFAAHDRNERILFPMPTIKDRLSEILTEWFAMQNKQRICLMLLCSTWDNYGTYRENEYLFLTQAIEAYSRALGEHTYFTPEEYEVVKGKLKAGLPANLPEDFRASFVRGRIEYANEWSLRKRIGKLLKSLEPETVRLFTNDVGYFVDRVVDTRNYLTHYGDTANTYKGDQYPLASRRLRMLLMFLLLRDCGIGEPETRAAFEKALGSTVFLADRNPNHPSKPK